MEGTLAPEVRSYKHPSGEYNLFKRCNSCGWGQSLHFLTDQRFTNKKYWFQCVRCGERNNRTGHVRVS